MRLLLLLGAVGLSAALYCGVGGYNVNFGFESTLVPIANTGGTFTSTIVGPQSEPDFIWTTQLIGGVTYSFSTCGLTGIDSIISIEEYDIYDGRGELISCSDDSCCLTLQTYLEYTPDTTRNVAIQCGAWSTGATGQCTMTFTVGSTQADTDGDGWDDSCDSCPTIPDPDQYNNDGDGLGDECDNCPSAYNPGQENSDGDLFGDACDPCPGVVQVILGDYDGDGDDDACDNCPSVANADQADFDQDDVGDACDEDVDDDGVLNTHDQCPRTAPNPPAIFQGCSVDDRCPCTNGWNNHGAYMNCVVAALDTIRDAFRTRAGSSSCGRR